MFDPSEEDFLYIKDLDSIIDLILNLLEDADEADVLTFLSYSTGLKFKRTTNVSRLLLNLLLFVPNYMLLYKHAHLPAADLPFLDISESESDDESNNAKYEIALYNNCFVLYNDLLLHLNMLSRCLNSYNYTYGKGRALFTELADTFNKHIDNIKKEHTNLINTKVIKEKKSLNQQNIKLVLHELIDSYNKNNFYYYFENNYLVKVEVKKAPICEDPYKYTVYALEDTQCKTQVINQENQERHSLHSILYRLKEYDDFGNNLDRKFLENQKHNIETYSAKDIISFHNEIVDILKSKQRENCKCCNPDLNNSQKTKLCNNCKQLNEKWENCRSALSKLIEFTKTYNSNKDFVNFVENGEFKSIVFDLKKNEKTSIVKLRNRRKRNLLSRINKLKKALERECFKPHIDNENVEQYVRICKNALIYIKDIKDLIKITFGNTTK